MYLFLKNESQTFIDKFRYNAKRASLVQSRIKVIMILTALLCNFMFQSPARCFQNNDRACFILLLDFKSYTYLLVLILLSIVSFRH